jgi:peroxiredoxin Q/BCP
LQSRLSDIRNLDGDVLAVSVDAPEQSREIVEAYGLDFPVLSDPDAEVVRAYGVLHADGGLEGDIARPATFVIDREGRVVWRDLTDNWRVRVRPGEIVERVRAVP